LKYVSNFPYNCQVITQNCSDEEDIQLEIRNLFIRTNMLTSLLAYNSLSLLKFSVHCQKSISAFQTLIRFMSKYTRLFSAWQLIIW